MRFARDTWDKVMGLYSGTQLLWGPTNVDRFLHDPKGICFFLSRYKFAGKMLRRCERIIDLGCGDGTGTHMLMCETQASEILGIDFEQRVIDHAVKQLMPAVRKVRPDDAARVHYVWRDFLAGEVYATGVCDGLACMDVIEHIEPGAEVEEFIQRIARTLDDRGIAVIGTPNVAAESYASIYSKTGHINLYDVDRLRGELEMEFDRVLMFSMNDETVHTGFDKMAHYLIAVAIK
jgi:2-polyprenyl-3-methyl-5-hydroxy-6-metoxy-1,4-benzoquinol methylase